MIERIKIYLKRLRWWNFWGDHFRLEQARLKGKPILEVGAGKVKTPGVTTLDFNPSVNPDILQDLNIIPWAISDSSFDAIFMFSVIEHVSNPLKVIEECHRILKPNGKIYILTPHFSSTASYADLTHMWHFSSRSFDYFISGKSLNTDFGFYSESRFILQKRITSLHGIFNYIPFFQWMANKYLNFWEDYLSFIIRGGGIYIVIEKQNK